MIIGSNSCLSVLNVVVHASALLEVAQCRSVME